MHKQLKNYPWDGLFAVLKACDMEISADKKDFFELVGHMRKGLGRNRNWRGRMTREDMMQLLYLFKCKTVHCTTARMPLYKWITLEGNVNRSYIVLVTGHFL